MRASEIRSRSDTPCFSSLAGIGRCPHSGMPGRADRAGVAKHHHRVRRRRRARDRRSRAARSWMSSNTIAGPSCASRRGSAAENFITAPSGHRLPRSTASAPALPSGFERGRITVSSTISVGTGVEVLAERLAGDGQRVQVQQVADLLQHRRQSAGVVEVLHQVLAGGLEVDQPRGGLAELVEQRQRQIDPEPARRRRSGG